MTSYEKVEKAMQCIPLNDKSEIPVFPHILTWAGTVANVPQSKIITDCDAWLGALAKTFDIIGNPDLESEYIHSMELSWRKMIGKTQFVASIYARRRTGVVDYVRRAYDAGVTLDSIINAGNGWRKGLELQVTTKPTKWWQLTANGDLSLHNFRATYEGCTSTHNTMTIST